jgi:hypothetical protein
VATRDTFRVAGKPTKNEVSREGERLGYLIRQLEDCECHAGPKAKAANSHGMQAVEVAELLGKSEGYISNIKGFGTNGRSGFGADIVRLVKDRLGIDPHFFYDDYDGPKHHKLYLLSAKRDEKRIVAIEEKALAAEREQKDTNIKLAKLDADLSHIRQLLEGLQLSRKRR